MEHHYVPSAKLTGFLQKQPTNRDGRWTERKSLVIVQVVENLFSRSGGWRYL